MESHEKIKIDFPHPFKGKTFALHAIVESARPGMTPALPEEVWRDNISAVWLNVIMEGYPTNTWGLYVLPKKDVSESDLKKALAEFDKIIGDLRRKSRTSFSALKQLRRAEHSRLQVEKHLMRRQKG